MSHESSVRVERLGKRFKIYRSPRDRAMEWLTLGRRCYHREFWALRDVSFEVRRGECLGVLGHNGAGKSTMLKLLTGVLQPTEGRFEVRGKLLSLLELGSAFSPELTGRQNLVAGAHTLGFPRSYLRERIADIEAFSELGEYLDRPLKHYSSGMQSRLAFSLFAFLESDVLLLDEVLSVGDVFFRQKCHARLERLRRSDTSVVVVSHNPQFISQFCDRALVLERGRLLYVGAAPEAVKVFLHSRRAHDERPARHRAPEPAHRPGTPEPTPPARAEGALFEVPRDAFVDLSRASAVGGGAARCRAVAVCDANGRASRSFQQGQWACFYSEFEVAGDVGVPIGSVSIVNDRNVVVHAKTTLQLGVEGVSPVPAGHVVQLWQMVRMDVAPGDYTCSVGLSTMRPEDYARAGEMSRPDLAASVDRLVNVHNAVSLVVTLPKEKGGPPTHSGLCDLPGKGAIAHALAEPAGVKAESARRLRRRPGTVVPAP